MSGQEPREGVGGCCASGPTSPSWLGQCESAARMAALLPSAVVVGMSEQEQVDVAKALSLNDARTSDAERRRSNERDVRR